MNGNGVAKADVNGGALHDEYMRLPGLFRRWELGQVIDAGADFHLEPAGTASDGTPLYAVYRRESGGLSAPMNGSPSPSEDDRGEP